MTSSLSNDAVGHVSMSYDVHLLHFQAGDTAPVAEAGKVLELLSGAAAEPPDEFGYCRILQGGDSSDLYGLRPDRPLDSLMFNHTEPKVFPSYTRLRAQATW
jgi:hypothetical protein